MAAEHPPRVWRELRFLAVERAAQPAAEDLVAAVSARVALPCRLVHAEIRDLAWVAGRDQLDADALLARLEALSPDPDSILVGLTTQDIGNPIFTFFFGRARLGGTAALVSLARLDPAAYGFASDATVKRRRAIAEILHELGHNAGLQHCRDPHCLMSLAANVDAVDRRGSAFCPACREQLPAGFHPVVRAR